MLIKPINNDKEIIILKKQVFKNTFFSSCFKYYYGNVIIKTPNIKLNYSDSFLDCYLYNKIIIVDYANVIHILFRKYKNFSEVSSHFYHFILKHLHNNDKLIIVSKIVRLEGQSYDILHLLNMGQKITGKYVDKIYFEKEQLCIYNLEYHTNVPISSSIDDLLQYFFTFVMFVYLNTYSKNAAMSLNRLMLITNDKQTFDKNLFGKTPDEIKNHIHYLKDVFLNKVSLSNGYVLINNELDQQLFCHFLKTYVTENIHTQNLECDLSFLLELINGNKKHFGYFQKRNIMNPNFIQKKYTKKIHDYSYKNLNAIQKKTLKQRLKMCHSNKTNFKKDLKKNYYLYAFIKYVQTYQNTITHGKLYSDFYGHLSVEQIERLF